jgi:hypothetical protein
VVETEMNLFLGKYIITLHHAVMPAVHIKLDTVVHAKSHQFSLLLPNLFTFVHCSLCHIVFFLKMSSEADQSSNIAGEIPAPDTESATKAKSEDPSTSSSTMVDHVMASKEIPPLYKY